MPIYFFTATENAHRQITRLFDFVWPTATAMWNLRWQVGGYLEAVPKATVAQLQGRFAEGANIQGANLKRACIDYSWDEQKESFARLVLTNSFAIYEGWLDEILRALGKNPLKLSLEFQFPSNAGFKYDGVITSLGKITATESLPMKKSIYPVLGKKRHYALSRLNEMLMCYRFFKEIRNCDIHSGGIASEYLVTTYQAASQIMTESGLGVNEVPIHTPPVEGQKINISLRGVVGFSQILLKIMATLDAEFCRSILAEKEFIVKWKRANPHKKMLSADFGTRKSQITKMTMKAGFPAPADTQEFGNWLHSKGLTQF